MITAEKARGLLAEATWGDPDELPPLAVHKARVRLQRNAAQLAQTVIELHAGRISCARCSAPMIAQEPDNTPGNDSLEVCSRCTRALYTEPPETGAQP